MSTTTIQPKERIQSIDMLRGIVMLIMALDHVRDFLHATASIDSPTNLDTTTPQLFFTRWITHFCAPAFVFLSGTSAFLAGQKKSKKELSAFLIKRGLWLVLVENIVITLALTFNPLYNLLIWQVIWAIGWSMVILGTLVSTSIKFITAIGIIIVFGHDVLNYVQIPPGGTEHTLISIFFSAFFTILPINKSHSILDLYAIIPWAGVMLAGYSFGQFFLPKYNEAQRRKIILTFGFFVTIFFIVVRFINAYGDPAHWTTQKNAMYTFLSFLNCSKYPPSLCYLSMTLGPALILLSLIETVRNRFTSVVSMYGRVPFFYYVLHFYLIHTICVIFFYLTGHTSKDIIDVNTPFLFRPQQFGFNLWIVYFIWLFVIVVLYKPCRWFDQYRRKHARWWLSYL